MLTLLLGAIAMQASGPNYANPVWDRDFPDPFIVRDGSSFYAYATHRGRGGFQLLESSDLVRWNSLGTVGEPEWADGQLWAPEVLPWKGSWYLTYSARDAKSRKRDLAISVGPGPKGPFRFLTKLVLGSSENAGPDENGAIDGTLHVERGRPYLLYIREAPPRSLKIVELASDLTWTIGEARVLLTADRPLERGILDAPTLLKRGGVYWLFYSCGWFQSTKGEACYRVYASSSSSLFGPYKKRAQPLLESRPGEVYSPGHQCVLQLPSGEWWLAYHAWDSEGEPMYGKNPRGRTLRLDRLVWTSDGPRVVGPTVAPQPAPRIAKNG